MARVKKPELPVAGSAYAFPLEDGRYSVVRVLLDGTSEQAKQWRTTILIACSAWIGDAVPKVTDQRLRTILRKTHHSWGDEPAVVWTSDPPPDELIAIGIILPTEDETQIECSSIGGWSSVTMQALLQWNWDNKRDAVLAADAERERVEAERRERAIRDRKVYLSRVTLDELLSHKFFSRWCEYPPATMIRASREIMKDTVEGLIALGPQAVEQERMDLLQKCIEQFNRLDAENDWIETLEREHICKEFDAIVHACGLGAHEHLADRWRDW
jgi:hypothetical protein